MVEYREQDPGVVMDGHGLGGWGGEGAGGIDDDGPRRIIANNVNNNNENERAREQVQQQGQQQQQLADPPIIAVAGWENRIPDMLTDHPAVVAFQSSDASFIVTDPRLPGNPIVYASDGFLELTGYPVARVLGRNCRFLQGPETDPVAVASMRDALDRGEDVVGRVLNYRFDGSTFWNEILISGIRDTSHENGGVLYFLGLQRVVDGDRQVQEQVQDRELDGDSGRGDT